MIKSNISETRPQNKIENNKEVIYKNPYKYNTFYVGESYVKIIK